MCFLFSPLNISFLFCDRHFVGFCRTVFEKKQFLSSCQQSGSSIWMMCLLWYLVSDDPPVVSRATLMTILQVNLGQPVPTVYVVSGRSKTLSLPWHHLVTPMHLSAHQLNCGSHAGRIRLARLTNSITDRPVYRRLTAMVRLSRLVGYDCNFECAQRRHAHCAGGCLQFTFTFASKWIEINLLRKSDV